MKIVELRATSQLKVGILLSLVLCFAISCSWYLSEDVEIVGVVQLSDNPASGHGGVEVSTGHLTTTSKFDGSYVLEGEINGDRSFTVTFAKAGYDAPWFEVEIEVGGEAPTDSDVEHFLDLGTVELIKIDQ